MKKRNGRARGLPKVPDCISTSTYNYTLGYNINSTNHHNNTLVCHSHVCTSITLRSGPADCKISLQNLDGYDLWCSVTHSDGRNGGRVIYGTNQSHRRDTRGLGIKLTSTNSAVFSVNEAINALAILLHNRSQSIIGNQTCPQPHSFITCGCVCALIY